MSLLAWILLGVLVWLLLSVAVALLVGRVVRQRDRQLPEYPPGAFVPDGSVPSPRGSDEDQVDGRAGARPPGGSPPR